MKIETKPWHRLTKIASDLLQGRYMGDLSDHPDDMPRTTPRSVMRSIAKLSNQHRLLAIALADIANELRP